MKPSGQPDADDDCGLCHAEVVGATRIAGFVAALGVANWIVGGHHVPDVVGEVQSLVKMFEAETAARSDPEQLGLESNLLIGFLAAMTLAVVGFIVHFLVVTRGIFLKGVGLEVLALQGLLMAVFATTGLALAVIRFRKELG